MNSAYELYIAVQVRADKPKSSLTSLSDNRLVVCLCEEDSSKKYCDKRVLAKGIYSDKHFLVIGQDADDEQKDGEGVMAWHDGAWFMELRIPLASDDTMDIQAVSGDIIRLNLLYGDSSKSGSSEPSLDSLVGIELDKLADWPSLLLATDPRTARAHSIEILGFPLDIWSAVGFFGQFLFGMRFIVQWLFSERAKRVVVPKVFWYLSICGSLVTLVYAIEQRDPVFTVSMCLNNLIYVRNLMLWKPGQSSAESI